ncbi:LytR/AlgR family response regulator transcription factor [Lacrimispora sp.]|uniref:LytR/AlgR family response regulator transcription factor n=1 Tax=Lacrimispora sp. TaxID=2719234 RepID=UPI00346003B8
MIRLAIVEDEKLYMDQLKAFIQTYQKESGNKIEIHLFSDGEEIVENYKAEFDIILMDIQMHFMDGMTAAEHIRKKDQEVIIMFITNMAQYAVKGYEVDAMDYILKPVSYFALSQKLGRAIARLKKRSGNYMTIPISDGMQRLDISKIYYIESHSHIIMYHTFDGEYQSRGTMQDLEDKLQKYGFFRCNKGYLVNMRYVEGYRDGCCIIADEKLPVSRLRKNQFLKAMADYMSEVMK